jgi:hypothetical protein
MTEENNTVYNLHILPNFHSNTHFLAQEDMEEIYDETFWARQRELLKEKDKFVSIDEL